MISEIQGVNNVSILGSVFRPTMGIYVSSGSLHYSSLVLEQLSGTKFVLLKVERLLYTKQKEKCP